MRREENRKNVPLFSPQRLNARLKSTKRQVDFSVPIPSMLPFKRAPQNPHSPTDQIDKSKVSLRPLDKNHDQRKREIRELSNQQECPQGFAFAPNFVSDLG
jgi:hypothetical protein